ncbi:MAG: hypothetical protein K2P42_04855 [Lachnospiraceae bacterium]|nr:hypothetical protein [Lachnospiraceae bacterium]
MKRVFVDKKKQIVIIPTVAILWSFRGILVSIAWLNVGCSILVKSKRD